MASLRNYTAALLVLLLAIAVVPQAFLGQPGSGNVLKAKQALSGADLTGAKAKKTLPAYATFAQAERPPSPETGSRSQASAAAEVRWISMEDALALNGKKKDKKPIFIDLYTDWCGWCKRMDATTFQDPVLVEYLNEHFHCVKFNAETNGPLTYLGQELVLPSTPRATHPFAVMVGAIGGNIGYPTVVLLDADNQKLTTLPGFQTAQALEPRLVYYAEGYYREFDFATFQGMYSPKSGQ